MKIALALLVVASLIFMTRLSRSTTHFTIKNVSQVDEDANVTVSIDRKVIFSGRVNDEASRFNMRLLRGKHYVVVKTGNNLVQTQEFKVNRESWVNIRYKAEYTLDPVTKQPLGDGKLSRSLSLEVRD